MELKKLLPEWVNKTWREGSMGAASKKTAWAFCITFTAIIIAVFIAVTVFRGENTGAVAKFISYVMGLVALYAIWKVPDYKIGYFSLAVLAIVFMIAFAIGFN